MKAKEDPCNVFKNGKPNNIHILAVRKVTGSFHGYSRKLLAQR